LNKEDFPHKLLSGFYIFIYFNSVLGAHPSTDPAGVTFFRDSESGEEISLRRKFVPRLYYAASGAEFDTISTPFAKLFKDYNFSLCHL
jgi:hypothetical protein